MATCSQCGNEIEVCSCANEVVCNQCGSVFDVVRHEHGQIVHGKPDFDVTSFLVGGMLGIIVGGIIFTPFGQALGKKAVSRGAGLAGAASQRVERAIRPK